MRRLLSCAPNPISDQRSTRHVEDRVRLFELLSQDLDSFDCRKNQQFDLVTLCLALYFFHHRQSAVCTGTNDELAAFPGYVLRDGHWRGPQVTAQFFVGRFFAVAGLSPSTTTPATPA